MSGSERVNARGARRGGSFHSESSRINHGDHEEGALDRIYKINKIYRIETLGKVEIDQPKVGPQGAASGTMQVNLQDFDRRRIQIGAGIRFANGAGKNSALYMLVFDFFTRLS